MTNFVLFNRWPALVLLTPLVMLNATFAAEAEQAAPRTVLMQYDGNTVPRVAFGAARLRQALEAAGYTVFESPAPGADTEDLPETVPPAATLRIDFNTAEGATDPESGEGFRIARAANGGYAINCTGASGALYGCLELAGRVAAAGRLPEEIDFADQPAFKLRGPCIGMQRMSQLPGRETYEYPYTPENFPFFYDKQLWIAYLELLVANRFNTLYLWNGHPFPSLVKLEEYPYALEVPEDVYQKNVEVYQFLTEEADRRGIRVIQMFYNIFVSQPFAEYHNIETQHSKPDALLADYNRKSIARFVEQYPNVGLLVCLGEALRGQENQERWMNETIIPGVKDGMARLGLKQEPPLVVRAHAVDNVQSMVESALKQYSNLYTMAKYNGESLTTWAPRGRWVEEVHQGMARLGSTHVSNVHLLSNLEPFRYGARRFIRKCMIANRDRLGARGLHLYPLAYWDWPNSPDQTEPLLAQFERDWVWFEAWGRYAWNPDRDEAAERAYWIGRLAEKFGSREAADYILTAYDDSGECAPRLLRRFGITEGNRQTLALGMTLDQLVNPKRYNEFNGLWEWGAPPGERLSEYAWKEWIGEAHAGETPPSILEEALAFSASALAAVEQAAPLVTKNREEFLRLQNDMQCIRAMCEHYDAKARAALAVLRYGYSKDLADMRAAEQHLARSVEVYKRLTELTRETYRFANTLQIGHRRIPFRGVGRDGQPAYFHWTQVLPEFEQELADFRAELQQLEAQAAGQVVAEIAPLTPAPYELLSGHAEPYEVQIGGQPFADRRYKILRLAPELAGLTGARFSHTAGKAGNLEPIRFKADQPVKVLIGYFDDSRAMWAKPPNLDVDSQAAKHGGVEAVLHNALTIEESPAVTVHVFEFPAGEQTFDPRGPGSYLFLGVIPADAEVKARDAKLPGTRQ